MKKIIYMAQSVNGYIAKKDNETPWTEDEWKCFNEKVKECRNLVTGSRTYELMQEQLESEEFQDIQVVVVTSKMINTEKSNINFVSTVESAIEFLESKNFQTMLIGGGSLLNSSFLKAGLVDEIYFDVEPKIFAAGIPFFNEEILDTDLELLEVKQTGKNSVQLHYKIVK